MPISKIGTNGLDQTDLDLGLTGNVGIGTSTPTAKLHVSGSSGITRFKLESTASVASSINFVTSSDANGYINYDTGTFKFFQNYNAAASPSVIFDASGNVGINNPTPAYKLDVIAPTLGNTAGNTSLATRAIVNTGNQDAFEVLWSRKTSASGWNNADLVLRRSVDNTANQGTLKFGADNDGGTIQFDTASTERMRVTANGSVLVGRTSTGFDKTAYGWQISRDAESFVTVNTAASCITFNRNNNGDIFKFFRDGTQRGWISVETTGTTYGTASDKRFKENFADAPEALSKINNVKVQSFDWKEGGHTDYGFVAQDLNTVLPFAVTVGDDGEEVEKAWGVDNTKIVPVLVKAIQEQQEIIESLKARVEALENK